MYPLFTKEAAKQAGRLYDMSVFTVVYELIVYGMFVNVWIFVDFFRCLKQLNIYI